MGILLAFAPFIVFAVVASLLGGTGGLIAGAVVAAALLIRDLVRPGSAPKVLEIGTAILFCGLALYAVAGGATGSIFGIRLCVDAGLLLIVLLSMAIHRPFTLQYAREQVPPEYWDRPEFVRANYVITAVWGLAFAVMVLADIVLVYVPHLPTWFGVGATVLALVGAVKFTVWYPDRQRQKALG